MKILVDGLVKRFVMRHHEHLSDEQLANLIGRELTFLESWIAERHLTACRHCRNRRWRLEGPRAQQMIKLYGEVSYLEEDGALAEEPRAQFTQWLQVEMRRAALQDLASQNLALQNLNQGSRLRAAMPWVSTGLAFGLMIGTVALSLAWRRVPAISANSLLVHAARWDAVMPTSSSGVDSGVAHQTIRIKTATRTLDRSLYWDLDGKRRPRHAALVDGEEQLKQKLVPAGVDWDRPISASAYREWHDHQRVRADSVKQTGDHLLTLTTTVPEGRVSQESITVRDTDFRPVQRIIGFRDNDTVEIAELEYSVLPWSVGDARAAFEPMEGKSLQEMSVLPRPHLSMAMPAPRSPDQLDETELAARLVLNNLNADKDEQIEVRRSGQGVAVEGLVGTDDRKRELTAQLTLVPGLTISIRSEADLSKSPPRETEPASVEAATLPDNPSPLETYLRLRGRPIAEINTMERQLFEGTLIIGKESRSVVDFKSRFVDADRMPIVTLATLEELRYSHHERLETALLRERALLAQAEGAPIAGGEPFGRDALPLAAAAERNLALARELTQTNVAHPRSAEAIFADMTGVLHCLLRAEREAYMGPEVNPAEGGKR